MSTLDASRISPTAHYTGYVWYRAGLSNPALRTRKGTIFFHTLQPFNQAYLKLRGGPTLEGFLLQRHLIIDHLLERAIEDGTISQVVEVAAGLSPRGLRMTRKYPDLTYVEGDLPEMAALKRQVLDAGNLRRLNHHVVTLNALTDVGPNSLGEATRCLLDATRGTAVITEGLLSYFDAETTAAIWRRFSTFLGSLSGGVYLTDLHVAEDTRAFLAARAFQGFLSVFARGMVHIHHDTPELARAALDATGFEAVRVVRPSEMTHLTALPRFARRDAVRVLYGAFPARP